MKKLYILFLLTSFIGFSQSAGDIVITEIMQNPAVISDATAEWFEVYNTTGATIDLDGWIIKDNDFDTHTISGSVLVPAGSYITLGVSATVNGGLTHAYIYGSDIALSNTADELVLVAPGPIEIDRVEYDGGTVFPDPNGSSMSLDPTLLAGDNNVGSNWCEGTSVYDAINNNLGTPGAANDVCPSCGVSFGCTSVICEVFTAGTDTYTAHIKYSGGDIGTTFSVTATAGSVAGGDDPSSVPSGTVIVTGIPEGTDITVTLNDTGGGGACDVTSATITSPTCGDIGSIDLELQGVIDFTVPSGGSDGKALHFVATADIADLSIYGVGVANNGGGTDGQEYTFPVMAVNNGDHILLARTIAVMESYLTTAGYNLFNHVLVATTSISQNGDDAIELYKGGAVVEIFGDVCVDGTGQSWDYVDSWAYKNAQGSVWPTNWGYGGANCTDGTTTIFDSTCIYPFVASLSADEFTKSELSIYPNPVSNGIVTIKSQLSGVKNIELYDMLGRSVLNTTLNSDVLDVRSLRSGLYLLKVSIGDRSSTSKLVIK